MTKDWSPGHRFPQPGMLVEDYNDVIGLTVAGPVVQQFECLHWIVWDSFMGGHRKGVEKVYHGWIHRVHIAAGAE